ncbi:UNVERIFIED_CONTAM: hypothetical protein GTU68_029290, partial [Idotea baltica]|nr:hypothetical protein [Idotea baltica]
FNAAHRLYRKDWDDAKNDKVFGKCNNPNFHGHNYDLIVSVFGEIDQETGFVMDMKVLKDLIKSEVEDSLDHKNLNLEVPEFKELNPTAENIAVVIWNKLRPHISGSKELEIVLYETPRNFVTFSG